MDLSLILMDKILIVLFLLIQSQESIYAHKVVSKKVLLELFTHWQFCELLYSNLLCIDVILNVINTFEDFFSNLLTLQVSVIDVL